MTTQHENTMQTKVYRYGLLSPIVGGELVEQQMRAAHRYRNSLVETELHRRDGLRALDSLATSILKGVSDQARARVEELVDAMRRERAMTRKRLVDPATSRAIAEARIVARDAAKAWRAAVAEARQSAAAQAARDEVNESALVERKEKRAGCGVYWGTYQLVEEADEAARKSPLWDRSEPMNPKFHRWTGDSCVSVQLVGGIDVGDAYSDRETQVRIVAAPQAVDRRDPNSRRSRIRQRVVLWLRVGSDEKRRPVWAQWPMVMHRPLPNGCRIKRVTVQRRMVGPRAEWSALFTIEAPEVMACGTGAIGVDVGWRKFRDELRIGMTCDEAGTVEDLRIPERIVTGLRKADELRGVRDRNFDDAKASVLAWMESCASVPAWISEATATLAKWRSQARLAALALRWRGERFEGDDDGYALVEAWRQQDKHLWLWETSQRTGALRSRKDFYRTVAARLSRRYGTLILEDFDLRSMARRNAPEVVAAENEVARSNRFVASISEFRDCLRSAFRGRGGSVVTVPAQDTTRKCYECGVVETFDAAANVRNTCPNGHEWDQDENAARNIVERWRGAPEPATARTHDVPTESRRSRQKRMRAEKVARMDRSQSGGEAAFASGVA